jgi:CDP-diacylglycerol--glycerol-3-phosphate 3-phosphatidyltransferase
VTGNPTVGGVRGSLLHLPNQLTIARLVLSVVFFVVLGLEEHDVFAPEQRQTVLNSATVLFVLAVSTDFLDGFLARRWGLVSTFGRIADPFVDKIVICGSFIMLIDVSAFVRPWFAVVILTREFLVSGLRSFLESHGVPFGATWSGKIKMITQSIAIPVVLFYEANFAPTADLAASGVEPARSGWSQFFEYGTITLLAVTLISTVSSSIDYLRRGVTVLRAREI